MKSVSKNDKNSLIFLSVIILMIGFIVSIYYGARLVPAYWIAVFVALVEVCFLMPAICYKFYSVKTGSAPFFCFIPGLNVLKVSLSSVVSILLIVCAVITAICSAFVFLPNSLLNSIFGSEMTYTLSYRAIGWLIMFVLVLSILIGLIYFKLDLDVMSMVCEVQNTNVPMMEYVIMLFAFIPFLRICSLLFIYQHLSLLCNINYHDYEEDTSYELSEEEDA